MDLRIFLSESLKAIRNIQFFFNKLTSTLCEGSTPVKLQSVRYDPNASTGTPTTSKSKHRTSHLSTQIIALYFTIVNSRMLLLLSDESPSLLPVPLCSPKRDQTCTGCETICPRPAQASHVSPGRRTARPARRAWRSGQLRGAHPPEPRLPNPTYVTPKTIPVGALPFARHRLPQNPLPHPAGLPRRPRAAIRRKAAGPAGPRAHRRSRMRAPFPPRARDPAACSCDCLCKSPLWSPSRCCRRSLEGSRETRRNRQQAHNSAVLAACCPGPGPGPGKGQGFTG